MLFRNIQNIDDDCFHQDNLESSIFLNPASTLTELCTQCESLLTSLLENHATLRTRLVSARPPSPWCKSDITEQKRYIRRKLERCWRKSKLTTDSLWFVEQCNMVKNLVFSIKMEYCSSLVVKLNRIRNVFFVQLINYYTGNLLFSSCATTN